MPPAKVIKGEALEKLKKLLTQKVQLIIKKVQDRKTQEVFENNRDEPIIEDDEVTDLLELAETSQAEASKTSTITFLSTMKSLAHTIQSKSRWEKFEKDHRVVTFSSRGDYKNINDLKITVSKADHPQHIVNCTLAIRIKQLIEYAKHVEESNSQFIKKRKLRFYFDEFDKYVDKNRPLINELVSYECVERVVFITATPDKIWAPEQGWSNFFILVPTLTDTTNYLFFQECNFIFKENLTSKVTLPEFWEDYADRNKLKTEDMALLTYHNRIIDQYPDILDSDTVTFAPGNITRVSHQAVADFWNTHECSVLVSNGERTTDGFLGRLFIDRDTVFDVPFMKYKEMKSAEMIRYIRDEKLNPESDAQLNDIVAEMYRAYNLDRKALIITGRLTVERAQTLVHPVWGSFSNTIYNKHTSPEDGYQQQRQLGHIKGFRRPNLETGEVIETYRGIPRVFCPTPFYNDVNILESRAHNFSKKYGNGYATRDDYRTCHGENLTNQEQKKADKQAKKDLLATVKEGPGFKTIGEANDFLTNKLKKKINATMPQYEGNKYLISSRLIPWYKKNDPAIKEASDLKDTHRITMEIYRKISPSQNISSESGQHYAIYPVYPTMDSPPEDVRFYVRYLPLQTAQVAPAEAPPVLAEHE